MLVTAGKPTRTSQNQLKFGGNGLDPSIDHDFNMSTIQKRDTTYMNPVDSQIMVLNNLAGLNTAKLSQLDRTA